MKTTPAKGSQRRTSKKVLASDNSAKFLLLRPPHHFAYIDNAKNLTMVADHTKPLAVKHIALDMETMTR